MNEDLIWCFAYGKEITEKTYIFSSQKASQLTSSDYLKIIIEGLKLHRYDNVVIAQITKIAENYNEN